MSALKRTLPISKEIVAQYELNDNMDLVAGFIREIASMERKERYAVLYHQRSRLAYDEGGGVIYHCHKCCKVHKLVPVVGSKDLCHLVNEEDSCNVDLRDIISSGIRKIWLREEGDKITICIVRHTQELSNFKKGGVLLKSITIKEYVSFNIKTVRLYRIVRKGQQNGAIFGRSRFDFGILTDVMKDIRHEYRNLCLSTQPCSYFKDKDVSLATIKRPHLEVFDLLLDNNSVYLDRIKRRLYKSTNFSEAKTIFYKVFGLRLTKDMIILMSTGRGCRHLCNGLIIHELFGRDILSDGIRGGSMYHSALFEWMGRDYMDLRDLFIRDQPPLYGMENNACDLDSVTEKDALVKFITDYGVSRFLALDRTERRALGDVMDSFHSLCANDMEYSADNATWRTYHDSIMHDHANMRGRVLVSHQCHDVRLYDDAAYLMASKMYLPPSDGIVSWFLPRTEEDLYYIGALWGNCISGYAHSVRSQHSVLIIGLINNMPYLAIELGVQTKSFTQAELPKRTSLSGGDIAYIRTVVEYSGGSMEDNYTGVSAFGTRDPSLLDDALTTVLTTEVILPSSIEGVLRSDAEYKQYSDGFHAKHKDNDMTDTSSNSGIDPVINPNLRPIGVPPYAPIGVPLDATGFAVDDQHWIDHEGLDDIPF